MKKALKYVLILGLVGIFCGWLFGFYLPTKPWYNDMKKKSGGSFTAAQIVKDFQANEDSAMKKYTDETNKKLVDVEGVIKEIRMANGKTNIDLASSDITSIVSFELRDSAINNLKVGERVILRGICNGYTMDVQFRDGIVVNK